ncbi:NACHT domain-containing protein [Chryseobacterium scophthalmum]|uniref:NACHT domain-containing protein n=2 Tax=Chryseobacterium TaxID=59732 RepID=UPI000C9EB4D4|nr:NACHT domain-containing protein [Chryseobacterium scophthalmum]
MIQINQDTIETTILTANKPTAISNSPYPLNSLDDRVFEILTYSIFKKRISEKDTEIYPIYDDVLLMQGVGDKGVDCVLTKENKFSAFIQCKKYSKNLSDSQILLELTKFSLHFYLNKNTYNSSIKFTYFTATSTGFTSKALNLFDKLVDKTLIKQIDLKHYIEQNINKYAEFNGMDSGDIEIEIQNIINNFSYKLITPSDYNLWINKFPEIISTFFEIKKVTDNSLIEKRTDEILAKINSKSDIDFKQVIEDFLVKYRKISVERLNTINFIGFDLHKYRQRPTDISLIDLFVKPFFYQTVNENNRKVENAKHIDLKIQDIFKSEKNLIILGDPGAGKSLLVKYLVVQICNGDGFSQGLKQYLQHVPFRVELRKYNEVRENKNIIEYVADLISKEMQINVSTEIIHEIIKTKESLFFFDGLDEIFDISHKVKIKELIESFSSSFNKSKCIVTSRFIGYHDIKFNSKKFDEFAIQKFKNVQIRELVNKFYATQIANIEKRKTSISQCLSQIENDVDIDLKSNPLIMTLILILSSNNIVIPDSKLEIYEACTKTLVESIDLKEKELKFEMPVKHKRLTFAHLAYWQYKELTKNQIISYDKTVKSLANFLISKDEVKEYEDAEEKAKKFLDYAEKRSIYFEDNFTHKTFLEYYTADFLYINYFTKASDNARLQVMSIITQYLPNSFWYIVFELLLLRVDSEQADEELLDEIINEQIKSDSINVFYFLVSNLSRLTNVSENVKYEILKKTILLCIKGEKISGVNKGFVFEEDSLLSKIYKLTENFNTKEILQKVINDLENHITVKKDLIELYILFFEMGTLSKANDHPLQITNIAKVKELAIQNLYLYSQLELSRKSRKIISPQVVFDQIKYFGSKSIFIEQKFRHRSNFTRIDTFNIFLVSCIDLADYDSFITVYNNIIENGIQEKEILNHLKNNRIYFFIREGNFEKLINFFLLSNSVSVDNLIILLIEKKSTKEKYQQYRLQNKNPKLKTLDKIFKIS